MWLLYAVAGMLTLGAADFSAAIAGRRSGRQTEIFSVTWLQQLTSLLVLAVALTFVDTGSPTGTDLLWGVATGVALGVAKPLLYAGLSFGRISVFAPITAVLTIVVPVAFSLARGERPGALALVGIALALPAVVLVGRDLRGTPARWSPARVTAAAVVCGTLLGASAITIGEMADRAGLRPVLVSFAIALVFISVGALGVRARLLPRRAAATPSVLAGVFEGIGFGLVALALQQGLVSVASALYALAPVVPVVLAWTFLREPREPLHTAAVVLAFVAVVLMTLG